MKEAGEELALLEAAIAARAELDQGAASAAAAPFDQATRNNIFAGEFPWGACTTGVLANKAELLQRFHRVRSTQARAVEEKAMLCIEAERSVIYYEKLVAAIEEAIAEIDAHAARPADATAEDARAHMERAGRAHLLRKHLADYQRVAKRARSLFSKWAPNVAPPAADAQPDDGGVPPDYGGVAGDDEELGSGPESC